MRHRSRRSKNRHRAVSLAPHELRHLPKLIPRPQCWPPPLKEQNASSHNYIERQTPTALARRRPFLLISEVVDNLSVFFLAEGEQPADEVMARLVTFIRAAKQTLAFAIYDMRFSDPLRAQLAAALRDRGRGRSGNSF